MYALYQSFGSCRGFSSVVERLLSINLHEAMGSIPIISIFLCPKLTKRTAMHTLRVCGGSCFSLLVCMYYRRYRIVYQCDDVDMLQEKVPQSPDNDEGCNNTQGDLVSPGDL